MMQRILIISDDAEKEFLRRSLVEHGLIATVAEDTDAGCGLLAELHFDLVLASLSDASAGVDLIRRIRSNAKIRKLPILAVAEWGTGQATVALSEGADSFERKPIDADRLFAAVEELLRPRLAMSAKASNGESDD